MNALLVIVISETLYFESVSCKCCLLHRCVAAAATEQVVHIGLIEDGLH